MKRQRDSKGRFLADAFRGKENYNWRGGKIIIKCETCNKEMEILPSRIKKYNKWGIFCGLKCKGRWQAKNILLERSSHWKGGKRLSKDGYVQIYLPNHYRARQCGYVYEHILVAEKKYRKQIKRNILIHHLNGVRDDNRPENLVLVNNNNHDRLSIRHALQKRIRQLEKELSIYTLQRTNLTD